jgi:imidazolonepropionase-like amidohydrolase
MGKKHIHHVVHMTLFALAISVMFIVSPLSAAEEVTAIRVGDLYTITVGIIKNGTILIKDGKISDIGQNIEIPEKAKMIDVRGKVVMPGLIAINADIIILDGHPFHHKTFVESTLINGKVLYEKSKSLYFSHITNDE